LETILKKSKQIRKDFNLVVENAFDFFRKSLEEFDKEPKYSVIHFHAAVELIMKARLLWDHWTLIITRPDTANLNNFRSGNFQSVSIKDAKIRLESIIQDGLTRNEYDCFIRLSDHRNRMVHFYHPGNIGNKSELEKIVAEQCLAWYYISKIFERWNKQFQQYRKEIDKIDKAMHAHRDFLKAKFGALTYEIKKRKGHGVSFSTCPSCGFKSFGEDAGNAPILNYECIVCNAQVTGLTIDCPKCGEKNKLIGEPWQRCHKCAHKIDENDIKTFFTKDLLYDKDDLDKQKFAHCCECDGFETVVDVNGIWICSTCFTQYKPEEVRECEWCNSLSTGNLDNSYYHGCVECEGMIGWNRDEDEDGDEDD
jgi:hypothetical protein